MSSPSPSMSVIEIGSSNPDVDFDFDAFIQPLPDEPDPMPPVLRSHSLPNPQDDKPPECFEAVLSCFPDLCHDYFLKVAPEHEWKPESIITHLLDEQEKGNPYPKRSCLTKRKRPEQEERDDEEELRKKFEVAGPGLIAKDRDYARAYLSAGKILLRAAYPQVYSQDIDGLIKENAYKIYAAYLALDGICTGADANPKYRFKKTAPKPATSISSLLNNGATDAEKDALEEFHAARTICQARAAKKAEEQRKEKEEADNLERARTEGTLTECGCCFDELPRNRMVHCNGAISHWFCRGCARRMAENTIGLSKYHLDCMSMDGCDATFSKDHRDLFLDAKLAVALDRIEQEAVLRMAGIENLETCPFCSYAEEYPPVEENKEFRCLNPECAQVSCRHCRHETHIPKTCDEAAREFGHSARRKIEEAMSAAMIRRCNKCATPFIKENGCNKMTCTRSGCRNVQCYVCSKSCDYAHFDDSARGGKKGNCPLFDSVEKRHEEEVQAAEDDARKQVAKENPKVDDELLKFHFSEKVKKDEERRKAANPAAVRPAPVMFRRGHALPGPAQGPGFAGAPPNPQQHEQPQDDRRPQDLIDFQLQLIRHQREQQREQMVGPEAARWAQAQAQTRAQQHARQVQAQAQAQAQVQAQVNAALQVAPIALEQVVHPHHQAGRQAQWAVVQRARAEHPAEQAGALQQPHASHRPQKADARVVQHARAAQRPHPIPVQVANYARPQAARDVPAQASLWVDTPDRYGERLAKVREQRAVSAAQAKIELARNTMVWLGDQKSLAARQVVGPFARPDPLAVAPGRTPVAKSGGARAAAKNDPGVHAAGKKKDAVQAGARDPGQAFSVLGHGWAHNSKRALGLADHLSQAPLPVLFPGPSHGQRAGWQPKEVIDLTGNGDGDKLNTRARQAPLRPVLPAPIPMDFGMPARGISSPGYNFPFPQLNLEDFQDLA